MGILETLLSGIILILLFALWTLTKIVLNPFLKKNQEKKNARKMSKISQSQRIVEANITHEKFLAELEEAGITKGIFDDRLYKALKEITSEDVKIKLSEMLMKELEEGEDDGKE